MATWTNIPDSVLEPGKPARSVDALALRDNPIAIAEGAAGAPRIKTAAIDSGAVTNVKIANMDAGKLNSGTVPGARLPMGHGGVGTYAWVQMRFGLSSSNNIANWGETVAGSNLRVSFDSPDLTASGASLSGTWRIMGRLTIGSYTNAGGIQKATLAVRIS